MSKVSETVLEIDLSALRHNYQYLTSKLTKNTKVMGVVKASGYGSDAVAIAKELVALGANYLAVAYTPEGVQLRDAGIEVPILVLHPQPNNFETLIARCLEPNLYSKRIFKLFSRLAEEKNQQRYPVHIKFNSGLNRLGFTEKDCDWLAKELSESSAIYAKSLFSHLAASEDLTERDFTLQQINRFKHISEVMIKKLSYRPMLHQSNTSAILNYPEAQYDMVRTGIGLYGYGNSEKEDKNLKPVTSLKSVISQIHTIEAGETVGYNRAHTASKEERTATIPIGHADGIPRQLGKGRGAVYINGQRAPIVGNVCMDMLMVNVTLIDCDEGDEVVIIGKEQSAVALSQDIGSISYELLTAISQRVKRVIYRNDAL